MEVTKQNFSELFPKIKESIQEATFLSIDCELTGLRTAQINPFDTIEQYYKKARFNCKDFLLIQFGLCAFRYDKDSNCFKQSSFNFYIFRHPINRNIPDQKFLCQTSSVYFLISQGFDFNKLFKEGIPYLNLEEEKKYRKNLEDNFETVEISSPVSNSDVENKIPIPTADQCFIDDVMKSIKDYLRGDDDLFQLPRCSSFRRKLIYQRCTELFGDQINILSKELENQDRVLYVSRAKSAEELLKMKEQKFQDEKKLLDESIGFAKVLRLIADSKKLIVGHNLMLDLLHTINKFLFFLPDDYEEFKETIHRLLPNILDTKFMCSSETFKELIDSSVLGHLLDNVKQEPFKIPRVDVEKNYSGYSLEDKKEHEAAFDAFITGISFLAMWNYLGEQKKLTPQESFGDFSLLTSFMNRIFLMKLQDNVYVNLAGTDPSPPRDHVFHISFPKEWSVSDIQKVFKPFGNIFFSYINETSGFVSLYNRDKASEAYRTLHHHISCEITQYSVYQANNETDKRKGRGRPKSNSKKNQINLKFTSRNSNTNKVTDKRTTRKIF